MPRKRQAARKIANLDVAPIDTDEQDELIDLLRLESIATNRLFINCFTVLLLIPIPLFVHIKYYRRLPIDALLSITTQVAAIVNLRYIHDVNFEGITGHQYLKWLKDPRVFCSIMNTIGIFVAWRRWEFVPEAINWLFFTPVISSITSTLVSYWITGLSGDIDGLEKLKYKYKSA
ncbi:CYFA0S02e06337g1_1 [Cyberlindnera fabianii]|uniref:CYFA0S02e06337g1_1 n=1 Tax=Cyberlindnera fabianii TaxID=36022 RepID=A0A061ATV8_CYBFA|nr:hypothetical protein BON22_0060 [Cyberlindnera fabianii]CDR38820.1 CYFA0S02e06337g1_1 [Cyberlindnera fabianii]